MTALELVKVQLVHDRSVPAPRMSRVSCAEDVAALLRRDLGAADREMLMVLHLDSRHGVKHAEVVSIGTLSNTLVSPREVFKAAILSNAAAIVVAHNHPSGDPEPSPEDLALTRRLHKAGALLGIPLLDHVVIAGDKFASVMPLAWLGTGPTVGCDPA